MSALETDFRLLAQACGLPQPELDVEVRDAAGIRIGIGDLAYLQFRTIVEVEGDHHRTSRAQWQRDLEKHAAYAAAGYELTRLGASQVRGARASGAHVVEAVLLRRGWRA